MESEDIFPENHDDDRQPVTRAEMRVLYKKLLSQIRWAAVLTLVGNQLASHVDIPTTAGYAGGSLVAVLAVLKLFLLK